MANDSGNTGVLDTSESEHERVSAFVRAKNQSPIALDARTTALIVVDMQRYFTQPSFPFTDVFDKLSPGSCTGYLERVREIVIPGIRKLLACCRARGARVLFTAIGTEAGDGNDLPYWIRSFEQMAVANFGTRVWPRPDDPSWQIDPVLAPRAGEPVLAKFSAGTFATTGLEQRLRNQGIESVLVTGVTSDVCVTTTAREAADRGFKTILVSDACTTLSEQMHRASLETFNIAFGWVRTADEVVALLDGRPANAH